MQNSLLAQSALVAHAVALLSAVVGNFGQAADPGATQLPVVWQHTSPAAHFAPPQMTEVTGAQTV